VAKRRVTFSVTVEALRNTDVLRYATTTARTRLGIADGGHVIVQQTEPFPRELSPGVPMGYTFHVWDPEESDG